MLVKNILSTLMWIWQKLDAILIRLKSTENNEYDEIFTKFKK